MKEREEVREMKLSQQMETEEIQDLNFILPSFFFLHAASLMHT